MEAPFGTNSNPSVFNSSIPRRSYIVTAQDEDFCPACDAAAPAAPAVDPGATATATSASAVPAPLRAPAGRQGIDALEVFELIRHLNDPEHPLTLEQLNVASLDLITVDDEKSLVDVRFTPTIPRA